VIKKLYARWKGFLQDLADAEANVELKHKPTRDFNRNERRRIKAQIRRARAAKSQRLRGE
jgi:hypothetical protein